MAFGASRDVRQALAPLGCLRRWASAVVDDQEPDPRILDADIDLSPAGVRVAGDVAQRFAQRGCEVGGGCVVECGIDGTLERTYCR